MWNRFQRLLDALVSMKAGCGVVHFRQRRKCAKRLVVAACCGE